MVSIRFRLKRRDRMRISVVADSLKHKIEIVGCLRCDKNILEFGNATTLRAQDVVDANSVEGSLVLTSSGGDARGRACPAADTQSRPAADGGDRRQRCHRMAGFGCPRPRPPRGPPRCGCRRWHRRRPWVESWSRGTRSPAPILPPAAA